jgi:acyl-CoA thioesterase
MAYEHSLDVRVVRKHSDGVTVECALREELMNSNGVLHGGVTAAIADEAAWHALIHQHKGHRDMTTTELKVNYLRPVAGKKVRARAYVLRFGKTLGVTRVDLFDAQKKLSAVAVVTYMLLS